MNSYYVKRITIDDLIPGMYVEDVLNRDGVLLLTADSIITGGEQIETLRRQGVASLYINIQKGIDLPEPALASSKSNDPSLREIEYYKELEYARAIHKKTVDTARDALDAIKIGQNFSLSKIEEAAQEMVASILRNPDAMISLSQIKGYDEYTYVHSVNVSVLATSLAYSMNYNRDQLLEVGIGGVLHDVGKMRVPESILNKPGKYTEGEFNIMKRHPELGLAIVNEKKGISEVSKAMVIQHHERYNGKGYPRGLKGGAIAEIALISAVADVYDALTSNRVYRAAWTPQKALAFIFQGCDEDYSREVVERFTKQMGIYPVGSFVKLASGELGVVTRVDRGNLLQPVVLMLFDEAGSRYPFPVEYDLSTKLKEPGGDRFGVEISLNPRAYGVDVTEYIKDKAA
jgi:putative nucleotidyltransferase with HDIG domain